MPQIVARSAAFLLSIIPAAACLLAEEAPGGKTWRRIVLDDQSPYEAAGALDVNGDGKLDVLSGDSWYEAPLWKKHRVRDVPASGPNPHYYEDFADLPLDVNGDGKPDIVTCTYFTGRVGWVENPGDPAKAWKEHEIDKPGPSETGQLVDLNGDGQLDFLPNSVTNVVWYELAAKKPEVKWLKHSLGKEGAGHGVGVGDINGDGRMDILGPTGWYEQPVDKKSDAWPYHKEFNLGGAGILILGRDFDSDGKTDIVWGMGHDYGLFWLRQTAGDGGKRVWTRGEIDKSFSQAHTLLLADLDGDGTPEVVTGKRVYAHEVEPGDTDAPCVLSFQYEKKSNSWRKTVIRQGEPARDAPKDAGARQALKDFPRGSVGTGLQLDARDLDGDGDLDLVCPGKSGLYILENPRLGAPANP